jgi:hypothetical protein
VNDSWNILAFRSPVAAEVRAFRPPEPYNGKGVKYSDERIFRKEGKKKLRTDSNGIAMATKQVERRKARIRRTIKAVAARGCG